MNKHEKIALAVGSTIGAIGWGMVYMRMKSLEQLNTELKVDNINLLRNTMVAFTKIHNGEPVPLEIMNDLEFRRLAFCLEFDDEMKED